jgi:branched-subunit amino acid transport protein
MDQTLIFITILGMLGVTYLPRLLPIWILASKTLPPVVLAWLRYVPVAVLSAMLLPALMVQDNQLVLGWENLFLWATLPTLYVARRTRSFFGAVLTGLVTVALIRYLSRKLCLLPF